MGSPSSPVPDRIKAAKAHEARVERALRRLGFAYRTGAAFEGLWFDYLVTGPGEVPVAIEAKAYVGTSLPKLRTMLRVEAAGKQELAGVPVLYNGILARERRQWRSRLLRERGIRHRPVENPELLGRVRLHLHADRIRSVRDRHHDPHIVLLIR